MLAATAVKLALAFVGLAIGSEPAGVTAPASPFPLALNAAVTAVFALGGALLVAGGRSDRRAVYLGSAYLLLATSFSNRLLGLVAATGRPIAATAAEVLDHLELDSFLALALWLFARRFPALPLHGRRRRLADLMVAVSGVIGTALFALHLPAALAAAGLAPARSALLPALGDGAPNLLSYATVLGLALGAVAFVVSGLPRSRSTEHRRTALFLTALAIGFAPIFTVVVAEALLPELQRLLLARPSMRLALGWVVYPCLMSTPLTTAWVVLRHRTLDLRLVARQALQYGLARSGAVALAAAPAFAFAVYLYRHRAASLEELFARAGLLWLLAGAATALLVLRYRRSLLDAIDRRFFREQYDARRILTLVGERIRSIQRPEELADLLAHGIDDALHLEAVTLLVENVAQGAFVDPLGRTAPLDASASLVTLLAGASEPLDGDLEGPNAPCGRLPEGERHWLVDARAALLVPVAGTDGSLVGVLVLGEKKSGLPFLAQDRELLVSIAATAALVIELRRNQQTRDDGESSGRSLLPTASTARECSCGRLHLPGTRRCATCGNRLVEALVPYVLPGKFRFEQRVGHGGMGVVYRATDLALGRPVAVKTLRRMSPEDAMRLRREARAAAAASHPNLAFIYGVETWRGTPLLVLEYLPGRHLGQRLAAAPFTAADTLELGLAISSALDKLHSMDILHRDVKPSNIGFSAEGVPKLTDFGIARLHADRRGDGSGTTTTQALDSELPPTSMWSAISDDATDHRFVGTLGYLSPEILAGAPPDPALDLWSLALVLYETQTGTKTFPESDPRAAAEAIRRGLIPPLGEVRTDCPAPLAELLARALDPDPAARPRTARELHAALAQVSVAVKASAAGTGSQSPSREDDR